MRESGEADNTADPAAEVLMKALYGLSVAIVTSLSAACLPARRAAMPGPNPQSDHSIVEVTNNNFEDLVVYWRKGEIDIAIGVASGMMTRRFVISPVLLGDGIGVQLAAGRRGKRPRHVSTVFDLRARASASWIVDYRAGLSTIVVR